MAALKKHRRKVVDNYLQREEEFKATLKVFVRKYLTSSYAPAWAVTDMYGLDTIIIDGYYKGEKFYIIQSVVHCCTRATGTFYDKLIRIGYGTHNISSVFGVESDLRGTEIVCDGFANYIAHSVFYEDSFTARYVEFRKRHIAEIVYDVNLPQIQAKEKEVLHTDEMKEVSREIQRILTETKHTSEIIDDIDITISIDELYQNTDALIELLSSYSEEESKELLETYKKAIMIISSYIEDFKALKVSDNLTKEAEEDLQQKIDEKIKECSKLANLE